MLDNVIFQWIVRRVMELGGLGGTLVAAYLALPPATQEALGRLLARDWQDVTLGSLAPIALAIWGYVWSFRSTVRPQVTVDNRQVPIKDMPKSTQTIVTEKARTVVENRGPGAVGALLKSLFGK